MIKHQRNLVVKIVLKNTLWEEELILDILEQRPEVNEVMVKHRYKLL